jgi:transcriptional regulator with XRE-family HTH domain
MKKLAELRRARGLSQTALAAMLRTSAPNVCMWELGKIKPRPNTLTRIAQALGCEESELIDDGAGTDGRVADA